MLTMKSMMKKGKKSTGLGANFARRTRQRFQKCTAPRQALRGIFNALIEKGMSSLFTIYSCIMYNA